jgi:hypothetical protein
VHNAADSSGRRDCDAGVSVGKQMVTGGEVAHMTPDEGTAYVAMLAIECIAAIVSSVETLTVAVTTFPLATGSQLSSMPKTLIPEPYLPAYAYCSCLICTTCICLPVVGIDRQTRLLAYHVMWSFLRHVTGKKDV